MKVMNKMRIVRVERIVSTNSNESRYRVLLSEGCILGEYEYNTVIISCKKEGLCDRAIQKRYSNVLNIVITNEKQEESVRNKFIMLPKNKIRGDSPFISKTETTLIINFSFDMSKKYQNNYNQILNDVGVEKANIIIVQRLSELLFGSSSGFDSYWWSGNPENNSDMINYDFKYED